MAPKMRMAEAVVINVSLIGNLCYIGGASCNCIDTIHAHSTKSNYHEAHMTDIV